MKRLSPLLAAAALSACGPSLQQTRLVDLASIEVPKAADVNAPAVILRWDEKLLVKPGDEERFSYSQLQVHVVRAVLTEAGIDLANIRIEYEEGEEIEDLRARARHPGGQVADVAPEQVIDEVLEEDDSGKKRRVRVFRVPGVRVGSAIEHTYLIRKPMRAQWSRFITQDLPVLRYSLDIACAPSVIYAFRSYHLPAQPPRLEKRGDWNHLIWEVKDLTAWDNDDEWRGDWTTREPFWDFRIKQVKWGRWVSRWADDWGTTLDWNTKRIDVDDELYAGVDIPFAPEGDVPAKTAAALREIAARTKFEGLSSWAFGFRPLKKVLDEGRADGPERTLLLIHLLRKAGVTVRAAALARPHTKQFDPDFPSAIGLNHLIAYLPAQPGLARPHFVDPSCISCRFGELPPWSAPATAVVLRAEESFGNKYPEYKAELISTADHDKLDKNERVQRYTLSVAEDGTVAGAVASDETGPNAIFGAQRRVETWKKRDHEEWLRKAVTARSSAGVLKGWKPATCVGERSTCEGEEIELELPVHAAKRENELAVPLTFLQTGYDGVFRREARRYDVVFPDPDEEVERVRLLVPAGYRVAALPAAASGEAEGVSFSLTAREIDGGVEVERRIKLAPGRRPAAAYPKLRQVFRAYDEARSSVVVLRRGP